MLVNHPKEAKCELDLQSIGTALDLHQQFNHARKFIWNTCQFSHFVFLTFFKNLKLDLELRLLNFSILGISSGHQAIVLAWVWATLIHSGCQTRLRIVPPRQCNDSEHNTAPPCYYDAVSCLIPHVASRIVNVRQCWMHLYSLLSHCLGALVAVKPSISLT